MPKFHINGKGKVVKCTATARPCPYAGKSLHVEADSLEEAEHKVFDQMKKENPILAGQSKKKNHKSTKTRKYYEDKLKMLESDEYDLGTYNLDTLEEIWHEEGHQVTFYLNNDKYSPEDYIYLVEFFKKHSENGIVEAGKWGDPPTPELCFHVMDRKTAYVLGLKFRQHSVFDWRARNKSWKINPSKTDYDPKWFIFTGGDGDWDEKWEDDFWKNPASEEFLKQQSI